MMDEQELDRQKALAGWDEQTCAEFEEFLDWWDGEQEVEVPCECYYVDVDLVDNRECPRHGRFV